MRIISYKNLKKNNKELAILKRIVEYSNKNGWPTERALQNCVQDPKFLQNQSESGTLGIAPNTDSKDITPSPIDSQFQYKHIKSKNFSLCFSDIGGFFSLGGLNTSKHLKKTLAIKVPYSVIENKYAIKIYDVKAGDYKKEEKVKSSKFRSGYFIINSNSEETIFNGDQFFSIKDKFDKFCKSHKGYCAGNTSLTPKNYCAEYNTQNHQNLDAFYKLFPNQYFKMESNKEFVWFPFDYLKKENTKDGKVLYCTQFRVAEGTEASILGTSFMKHYDFFFDRINTKLIIFRSTCDEKDNDVAARVLSNDPRKTLKKILSPYAKVSIS